MLPKPGIVQDAPRFEPLSGAVRLAWSEFDPTTIVTDGPTTYGLWVHNYRDNVGQFACTNPAIVVDGVVQRCFGQHLAWPRRDALIVTQSFFEVFLDGSPPATGLHQRFGSSVEGQQLGSPLRLPTGFGFSTFPISASYLGNRMIFDGIVNNVEGNQSTLSFWIASVDGTEAWRLQLAGYGPDLDTDSTNSYLFSVATPAADAVTHPWPIEMLLEAANDAVYVLEKGRASSTSTAGSRSCSDTRSDRADRPGLRAVAADPPRRSSRACSPVSACSPR